MEGSRGVLGDKQGVKRVGLRHPHLGYLPYFFSLVSNPSRGASAPLLILPAYPPVLPYSLPYTAPSLVSTHIYLIRLTFSLGPDVAATV